MTNLQPETKIGKRKPSKIQKVAYWVIAIFLVAVTASIIYGISFDNALTKAKQFYAKSEYISAGGALENYKLIWSNKDEVEKIRFARSIGTYYDFYKMNISSNYLDSDNSRALSSLIRGLKGCILSENEADTEAKKSAFDEIKSNYLSAFKRSFSISSEKAMELANLDYDKIDDRVKSIINPLNIEKAMQEYNNENPIEFRDLALESNSLFTIASGSVYNRGNTTVRFVKIKIAFEDKNGNVIDTDSTYAVGNEGLSPGESSKWSAYVDKDYKINNISVSIIEFK